NLERAAEVAAKSFVVMARFGNFVAGDRKGSGVERGVFVAVVKTKTNAIHFLASQPPPSPRPTTTSARSAAGTTCSALAAETSRAATLAEKLSGSSAATTSAPSFLSPRRSGNETAKPGGPSGPIRHKALTNGSLQKKGIRRGTRISTGVGE